MNKSIYEKMDEIFENYNLVELKDCDNWSTDRILLLNKKHSIEDFQDAIYKAKDNHEEERLTYGNDWEYISEDLDSFDYYEIGAGDYYVEY